MDEAERLDLEQVLCFKLSQGKYPNIPSPESLLPPEEGKKEERGEGQDMRIW